MKLKNKKLLIIGKSASGKDTIARELHNLGLEVLLSYTTRKPRKDDLEYPKHIYVTDEEFEKTPKNEIMAYAELYGSKYWATKDQFNKCDIYVIDPSEAVKLKENHKDCLIVSVYANDDTIRRRFVSRKDDCEQADKKYLEDLETHKNDEEIADFVVDNNGSLHSALNSLIDWLSRNEYI
jgi:guanylate kinase